MIKHPLVKTRSRPSIISYLILAISTVALFATVEYVRRAIAQFEPFGNSNQLLLHHIHHLENARLPAPPVDSHYNHKN
jgi:hypothetical protein